MSTGYDLLLEQTGHYGSYQKRKLLYMYFAAVIIFMPRLAWMLLGATPPHRCLLPFEEPGANFTLPDSIRNASIPRNSANQKWSQCSMLVPNESSHGDFTELPCDKYVYDNGGQQSSVVAEWDLVCGRSWMRATAQAVFDSGILCGSILLGMLSDKIGRKTTLCLAIVVTSSVGALLGLMPELYSFMALRFVVGFTSAGTAALFVLGVELLGPRDRVIPGVVFNYFFSISFFLFGLYAYLIPDWRWLQISISLTGLILVPYWWILPESNRWLILKGKLEEAKRNILQAAKVNKVHIDPAHVERVLREAHASAKNQGGKQQTNKTVKDILVHPELRLLAWKICFIWFTSNAVYWGLNFNVSNLGGNLFLNFLISGAVEFPAYTSLFLFDKYVGRRGSLSGLCLTAGIMLLATAFVPGDMAWLTITFAMAGKMAIGAAYALVYIYTSELYPTVVRNAGMGMSSTSARIGGITAPYVLLLADIWKPLPMVMYGCLAVMGGLLALLLPETKGLPLPETMEDLHFKTKSRSRVEVELADKLLTTGS